DVGRQFLSLEYPRYFVHCNVDARDIDSECPGPLLIAEAARVVRSGEDARSDDDVVHPSIREHHVAPHAFDARAVGDVAGHPDCRSTIADAAACETNSFAAFGNNLIGTVFGCFLGNIDAYDMCAFGGQTVGDGSPYTGARANDDGDLPLQLFLRR